MSWQRRSRLHPPRPGREAVGYASRVKREDGGARGRMSRLLTALRSDCPTRLRFKQLSTRVKQAHARVFSFSNGKADAHEKRAVAGSHKQLASELQRLSQRCKRSIAAAPSGASSHNIFRLRDSIRQAPQFAARLTGTLSFLVIAIARPCCSGPATLAASNAKPDAPGERQPTTCCCLMSAYRNRIRIDSSLTAVSKFLLVDCATPCLPPLSRACLA